MALVVVAAMPDVLTASQGVLMKPKSYQPPVGSAQEGVRSTAKKPNYPVVTPAPGAGAELLPRVSTEVLSEDSNYM